MALLVALGVFCALFAGSLALGGRRRDGAERHRQLRRRMGRPEVSESVGLERRRRSDPGRLAALAKRVNVFRMLEEQMLQAGLYLRVSDLILIVLLLFGAGAAAGQAAWGDVMLSLGCGAALAALPILYVRLRMRARLRAFAAQLPFALDLIKSSLEAGHSLLRSFQVVVGEFADPIQIEFRTLLEQVRLGLPLSRAMDDMFKRVPQEDLRLLLTAIKVQSRVGSSLAELCGRLSEVVRTRQRLRLQIRALTAQSRMSGVIVGALPIVVLSVFSLIQPAYTQTLFHDATGLLMLKVAVGLDLAAVFFIRRMLRAEF